MRPAQRIEQRLIRRRGSLGTDAELGCLRGLDGAGEALGERGCVECSCSGWRYGGSVGGRQREQLKRIYLRGRDEAVGARWCCEGGGVDGSGLGGRGGVEDNDVGDRIGSVNGTFDGRLIGWSGRDADAVMEMLGGCPGERVDWRSLTELLRPSAS